MLKSEGEVLVAEPKGQVTSNEFERSVFMDCNAGLKVLSEKPINKGLCKLLIKQQRIL